MPFEGTMVIDTQAKTNMPDFSKPTWHSRGRLDIRPVCWSLRNRPNEWSYRFPSHLTILHEPSGHTFWVGNGFFFYELYETDGCSCRSDSNRDGHFTTIQKVLFGAAYMAWRKSKRGERDEARAAINKQFASHFLRD